MNMSTYEIENRLEFLFCCIGEFAARHSLTNSAAYRYLINFGGLDFIDKHYRIEHTQSMEDIIDDMTRICHRHGGALS